MGPSKQVLFSELTTLAVGGPARRLVEARDVTGLCDALAEASTAGESVLVVGGGSNLLVSDAGFDGTVVRMDIEGRRARSDGDFVDLEVGAGEDWSSFVGYCVSEGLSGVECLAGVPGRTGGTPVQNVGAYGQEVSQVIARVEVWDTRDGCTRWLTREECGFGYRTSIFKRRHRFVVTRVTFRLWRSRLSQPLRYPEVVACLGSKLGARAPADEVAAAVLELRAKKGMVLDPRDPDSRSAGSFFTNPIVTDAQISELVASASGMPNFPVTGGTKVAAAWLVEHAGFPRGYTMGRAAISSKHALAITTRPGASANDVVALARRVRHGVAERFGIDLEPEPVLVGVQL